MFKKKKNNLERVCYDNYNSIPEVLESCMSKYEELPAVTDTYNNVSLSYGEMKEKMNFIASGLQALGVQKGDKIAHFSESHGLWVPISLGILKCGAIDVIRGSNAPITELDFVIGHADCSGLILRDSKTFTSLRPYLKAHNLKFIIITYYADQVDTSDVGCSVYSLDGVIELGKKNEFKPVDISRSDASTMLYTSGTTGNPKGVLLSHEATIYQIDVCHSGFLSSPGENTLQILPIWHAYERIGEYYYVSRGCHMHFTTLSGIKNDLAKYNINTLMSVPRIWEALRTGIYQKLRQSSPMAYKLFVFAIKTSILYKTHKMYGERRITNKSSYHLWSTIMHRLIRSFIKPLHILFYHTLYKKIKQAAGLDTIRASLSGGGALSMQDELFYDAIGIDLRIGYGLTETSPVLTLRSVQDKNFLGSAGKPVPGTDVKVVNPQTLEPLPVFEKGLVIAKGPQIMKEYYKDEAATKKAITEDGYFITGDLGWLTKDNNLVLVGRLKETIVLSSGENVEPVPIEEAILLSPYIDQIVLVGQDQTGIGALIVPSKEALEKCGIKNIKNIPSYKDGNFANPELEDLIKKEINLNILNKANLRVFEKVKQFALLKEAFTIENGLLSMTQKIKRNKVFEKYQNLIDKMFKK